LSAPTARTPARQRRRARSARPEQSRAERFKARAAHLWRTYRFTPEQWMEQYRVQGGCCYFCGKPGGDLYSRGRKFVDEQGRRELDVLVYDHEHRPPYRFRGLGHSRCNRLAGLIERALADPPAWREGGVQHVVPADRVVQLEARAVSRRVSRQRRRGTVPPLPVPEVGERQTYRFPQPSQELLEALAEIQAARTG
jgi:hypothetical protein